MGRHWLTFALLAALVAGGIALLNSPPRVLQPDAVQSPSEQDAQLTGYMTDVNTTQYNLAGSTEYNFTAEQMSHFRPDSETDSEGEYTTISTPFFTFYRESGSPWYAQSRQGRSTQNGETVTLREDVRLWRDGTEDEPVVLTTSKLVIKPEAKLAETDQFVTITYPRALTQGVGMQADLRQETFSILSQGNTIYEPNP